MFVKELLKLNVRFEEVFHLKNLYKMMREWLYENGYTDSEKGGLIPEEYMEIFYLEKITQQGGRELWFWWRLKKSMSSYVQRQMDVDVHVLNMKNVEVMAKGHKFKSQKGEVEVMISTRLVTDPDKKWENNIIMGRIVDFFRKRIYYKEWLKHVEDFAKDTYRLQEDVKKYLELQAVTPWEIFTPTKGI